MASHRNELEQRVKTYRDEAKALHDTAASLTQNGFELVTPPLRSAASYLVSAANAIESVLKLVPKEAEAP